MPSRERYSDYDDFAWVYNKHWGVRFAQTPFDVLEKLVFTRVPEDASILDLCCGTGHKTRTLAERGYAVTGMDSSEEMLKYARENAPDVKFILDDARTFKLPAEYDVVVSMFDSLNHVMSLDELAEVFRNVYKCLKPGGLFQFDVNMEQCYVNKWQGYHGIVEDDHICVFPNSYDAETRIGHADFTLFRLEKGAWRRSDFKLTQKWYSEGELHSAIQKAGFATIQSFEYDRASGELKGLTQESDRAFFLCTK